MKHAYLIMAHNEFDLLEVLISMLDDARNDIYVHIDKKAKGFNTERLQTKFAHLQILCNNIDGKWGHLSLVRIELCLFKTAYNNGPYAYYHLLSGVDLPIKSQDYIHKFFEDNKGKEFLGFWNERDSEAEWCISKYHFLMQYQRGYNKYINIITSKIRRLLTKHSDLLFGIRQVVSNTKKGFEWVSITNEAVSLLICHSRNILSRYKYTFCPDEIYKHTLIWNSKLRDNIYNLSDPQKGSLRKIDWEKGNMIAPYIWTIQDLNELMESDLLFARKFSMKVDAEIVYTLKERIAQKNVSSAKSF